MTSYTPDALGQVVRDLRIKSGLTQEELGARAGYKSGPTAGVSISRLEKGHLVDLSRERFERVAEALGVSAQELSEAAGEATETPERLRSGLVSIRDRADWVQRVVESRKQLVDHLGRAFSDAHERATNDFLLRFREIAARVGPKPLELSELMGDHTPEGDGAEAEAKYGFLFTQFGLAEALAASAVGAAAPEAVGAAADNSTFTAAVARAIPRAGAQIPASAAATGALVSSMSAGTPTGRGPSGSGRNALLAVLVAAPVALAAGLLVKTAQRSRKQQQEITSKLDEAEKEIDESQRNVDALRELMPEATEILDYIAIHAAHALNRWATDLGDGPLEPTQEPRYYEFVKIAAAQLAVANLDFQNLMTNQGEDLDHALDVAREILTQSRDVVTSLV